MGDGILVFGEQRKGRLEDTALECMTLGRSLAEASGGPLVAVVLGKDVRAVAEELAKGADEVLLVDDAALQPYSADAYIEALAGIVRERAPRVLLLGHTSRGWDVAPALAARLDCGIVTDCVKVAIEGGAVVATRNVYNGKVVAEVEIPAAPAIVTLQPAAIEKKALSGGSGKITARPAGLDAGKVRSREVEVIKASAGELDLSSAEAIVSVGRGIGKKESIPVVKELADVLGAGLGASRPLTDMGWVEKARQVGTSGQTVKPKLYVAVGISGAVQHLAGMKGSDLIVAINKDPNAPIFKVADYGVVGDLFQIVPALVKALKEA
ncbi:MAG: electron transfer flavoprotein subunit alpha/FixB family protein [Methanobacteriota archaeon]